MQPVTMNVAICFLLSVLSDILCAGPDVTRFQHIRDKLQVPKNITKHALFWLPEIPHTRTSSDTTARKEGTISPRQSIHSSTERTQSVMSETPLSKQLDGENVSSNTTASFPVGGVSSAQVSDFTVTGRLQKEPLLDVAKLKHETLTEDEKTVSSSTLSLLFPDSHSSWQLNALSRSQSTKQCICENLACICSGTSLTTVPQNLPVDITKLLLGKNQFQSLTNKVFYRYRHLEFLDLVDNNIKLLDEGTFLGLDQLISLNLSMNRIGDNILPKALFEPLTSLKYLRMDQNHLPCYENSSFYTALFPSLSYLEELYIDSSGEQYYDLEFTTMTSLQRLTISCHDCSFDAIYNSTFENLGQLKTIEISGCRVQGAKIEYGAFSHFTNLKTLDISRSPLIGLEHLPRIFYGLRNSDLQTLKINSIVDKYSLNVVHTFTIQYLPQNLTTLVARGNNIVYIDPQVMKILPMSLRKVDISDNDITMNPLALHLADIQELEILIINNINEQCPVSGDDTSMQSLQNRVNVHKETLHNKSKMPWSTASENTTIIPLKLKRVEMSVREMNYEYMSSINNINSVEEIDLSCSYIPTVYMDGFANLPKLRYLNLASSSIKELRNPHSNIISLKKLVLESNYLGYSPSLYYSSFEGLPNLSELDLSLNQIKVLNKELLKGVDNLEYLQLSDNMFSEFLTDISHLHQLKLLNLSNTQLPCLTYPAIQHITQLTTTQPGHLHVDMSDCPIQCDCFNLDFLKWMVNSPAFDQNFTGYKCRYRDTSIKYIQDGYKETLLVLTKECAQNYPFYLVIVASTLLLLSLVMTTIIYRFRWKIRFLYYAASLKIKDNNRKDNNHPFAYDAFIVYDSEDKTYVEEQLVPALLERELVLLVHRRDFVAGSPILSNIVMAVTKSRKTLVVLTRKLVESRWCNYEIQMATMEAVHTGRQVLMFLLKEDIPNRELDVELLRHIQTNTYMPYPDPEDEGDEEYMKSFYDKMAHDIRE